ncbi:hypothetical protein CCB80_00745 [Armatimonadetes bacterium Uphvl-Ar1]|nr:hypothetical protein CCB80_00745 [Armatimonadetes bacterium Uphvl-Ar1]
MKRFKKTVGMTTIEALVSGAIMVGVIVMSFDVMIAGVKVSQKAVEDSEANKTNRSVLERFVHDVNLSEAIVGRKMIGLIPICSRKDSVTLRQPVFNPDGSKRPNEFMYVTYYFAKVHGKDNFYRVASKSTNGIWGLPQFELIAENVHKYKLQYSRRDTSTFDAGVTGFPLLGSDDGAVDSANYPPNGQLRVESLRLGWNGMSYDSRSRIASSPGVQILGNRITANGMGPGTSVSVQYGVHPEWRPSLAQEDSYARAVHLDLVIKSKGPKQEGESELSVSSSCKN